MSVEVVLAVLKAAPAVTAIVGTGTAARISPLIRAQAVVAPCVTLQRISVEPTTHLRGDGSLDAVRVQLDAWADSYAGARALATACRAAMRSAGHVMVGEFDSYEPEISPELYRITQDYQVWV